MAEIKAKKVIFKNRDGEYLIPYVGDTAIDNRITNCLLEVPQNIKLELNNGTLTLKAGSKVIVPNGFEADGTTPKFDEVIVATNRTLTPTVNKNGTIMMYLNGSNQSTDYMEMGSNFSSATQPNIDSRMYAKWYDTTENKLKWTKDGGATWNGGYSFPICIFKTSDTANADGRYNITSIEQVFNGFGYIGSTIWVDKGVKGLIPNGRNEDGSLRNIEYTQQWVKAEHLANNSIFYIGVGSGTSQSSNYVEQEEEPTSNYTLWYKPSENKMYRKSGSGVVTANTVFVGFEVTTGNKGITSFQPKQPFRAVDYNDAVVKSDLQEVHCVVETYRNGTSWYRIWSDKWCEQGGLKTGGNSTITFLKTFANTDYYWNIYCNKGNASGNSYSYYNSKSNGSISTLEVSENGFWYACGYIS